MNFSLLYAAWADYGALTTVYFHYEFVLLFIRLVHVYETPANLNNSTRAFTLPLTLIYFSHWVEWLWLICRLEGWWFDPWLLQCTCQSIFDMMLSPALLLMSTSPGPECVNETWSRKAPYKNQSIKQSRFISVIICLWMTFALQQFVDNRH